MPETFVIFHILTLLHISLPSAIFILFIKLNWQILLTYLGTLNIQNLK